MKIKHKNKTIYVDILVRNKILNWRAKLSQFIYPWPVVDRVMTNSGGTFIHMTNDTYKQVSTEYKYKNRS